MDVDIDLATTFRPLDYFPTAIRASQIQDGHLKPHNVGVYFQAIPIDPLTSLAAIPYDKAEEYGFFKIDFLHLSILDIFENKEQIRILLQKEPNWTLLQMPSVVQRLFQVGKQFELLSKVKPQSVMELADCIALIRPGKRQAIKAYLKAKERGVLDKFRKFLYAKPNDNKAYFKKPHAVAYSLTIVLQLHLIEGGIL